ncbi:MAG: XRE family transcriptional regulator [Actinomycetota bacterium]|nr:XRE family transcriptional regulator [Actinomycetota bacterium]
MAKKISDVLKDRPVNRKNVDAHKKRMIEEVRSYRLRELRKASDLSQVELAQRLNISQNRVSRIEHGDIERAQLDTLRRYVEAVGGELSVEVSIGDERFLIA